MPGTYAKSLLIVVEKYPPIVGVGLITERVGLKYLSPGNPVGPVRLPELELELEPFNKIALPLSSRS